jgi:conjugal transfer pilus assembly protein TraB
MAGFFGGIATAAKPQPIQTLNNSSDGNTQFNAPNTQDLFKSSAYGGASNAAERIADYLIKSAENIFPVIEIDAGRKVDFVVQRGVMLRLRSL